MTFQAIDNWYTRIASAASIAALFGFLISYFIVDPITLTPRVQIVSFTLIVFACIVIFMSYKSLSDYAYFQSPKLLQIISGPQEAIFLFQPARWVSHRAQYSIFYVDDIENYLGVGLVINVQNDGKIQILVSPEDRRGREIYDKLLKAGKNETDRVIIKPGFITNG